MSLVVPMQIETVDGVSFPLVAAVGDMNVDRLKQGLPQSIPTQEEGDGVTITVVSQTGPAGAGGASGAPGASQGASLTVDFGTLSTDTTSEAILDPGRIAHLEALPAGTLNVSLTGRGKALGGATGTFKLRLGGTDGGVDGTVLATLTITGSGYDTYSASGTVANPVAASLVKLTGYSSVTGLDAILESIVCVFTHP